jgi:hypothetical protein
LSEVPIEEADLVFADAVGSLRAHGETETADRLQHLSDRYYLAERIREVERREQGA